MKTHFASVGCLLTLTVAAFAGEGVHPPNPSPGVDISVLLAQYEKLTGKRVISDPNVNGIADLVLPPDATDEKKAELIEKQLFLDGFALFESGDDVVEVLGVGKQVRCAGVPLYTKPEELPQSEKIVSFAFKLEHRDPARLASVLGQYFLPGNQNGFTPDPESRTLIVTGQTSLIRIVIKLMPLLDVAVDAPRKDSPASTPIAPPANTKPILPPKVDGDGRRD